MDDTTVDERDCKRARKAHAGPEVVCGDATEEQLSELWTSAKERLRLALAALVQFWEHYVDKIEVDSGTEAYLAQNMLVAVEHCDAVVEGIRAWSLMRWPGVAERLATGPYPDVVQGEVAFCTAMRTMNERTADALAFWGAAAFHWPRGMCLSPSLRKQDYGWVKYVTVAVVDCLAAMLRLRMDRGPAEPLPVAGAGGPAEPLPVTGAGGSVEPVPAKEARGLAEPVPVAGAGGPAEPVPVAGAGGLVEPVPPVSEAEGPAKALVHDAGVDTPMAAKPKAVLVSFTPYIEDGGALTESCGVFLLDDWCTDLTRLASVVEKGDGKAIRTCRSVVDQFHKLLRSKEWGDVVPMFGQVPPAVQVTYCAEGDTVQVLPLQKFRKAHERTTHAVAVATALLDKAASDPSALASVLLHWASTDQQVARKSAVQPALDDVFIVASIGLTHVSS